jgi:hypothetical protein
MWADKIAFYILLLVVFLVMVTNPTSQINTWAFWSPQIWPIFRLALCIWFPMRLLDLFLGGPRRRVNARYLAASMASHNFAAPRA